MTKFDQIRQSLIREIDDQLAEIASGSRTWFSLKVMRHRNGEIKATVQSERDIQGGEENGREATYDQLAKIRV